MHVAVVFSAAATALVLSLTDDIYHCNYFCVCGKNTHVSSFSLPTVYHQSFGTIPTSRLRKSSWIIKSTPNGDSDKNSSSSSDEGNLNRNKFHSSKNFVSPEELQKIKDSVDIVALVESYNLHKFKRISPNKATCICPFHDDSNPSLSINGELGIYKCFSCGSGGDALSFVLEYSKRHSNSSNNVTEVPLTFLKGLRVLEDFAELNPIDFVSKMPWLKTKNRRNPEAKSNIQINNQSLITTSPERIILANLHAAAYYEHCLVSLPSAGLARTYLRSRGIHPSIVKAFSIGFAPESYFSSVGQQQQRNSWGEGSLVHRLREEGFNPQEILDAGLAILTKKGKQKLEEDHRNEKKNNNEDCDNDVVIQQEHLMDRFRGRLVVPIFDETGTKVLGFGGRILDDTSGDTSSNYKAAKYLNSPESLVFHKKELLFGLHMVQFVTGSNPINEYRPDRSTKATMKEKPSSLIVVEGYMDAIALWQAGVKETVASMGTALSQDQLLAAANTAAKIGGNVVLCLDNDAAGIAAVTRLCSGSEPMLLTVTKQSRIKILVAKLPDSVKDPAEFLEKNPNVNKLDEKFRNEVIRNSQEWKVWYMCLLIDTHDSSATVGENGSFSKIFDDLAFFLSVFESTEEQIKMAEIVAPKLGDIIDTNQVGFNVNDNKDNNKRINVSRTGHIELASNLVEKAAILARSRSKSHQMNLRWARNSWEDNAFVPRSFEISQDMTPEINSVDDSFMPIKERRKPPTKRKRVRLKRRYSTKPPRRPMTNHIAGFKATTFDDEWLGVTEDKYTGQRNPLRYDADLSQTQITFAGTQNYFGPASSIRFNKNDYHGTWTTSHAIATGYKPDPILNLNMNFLEKGSSTLIQSDEYDTSLFVEELLFNILIRFSIARKSLYESIRISESSVSRDKILWTSPEKSWLFKCLVEEISEIPLDIVGPEDLEELRSYLMNRPDAIPGAFDPGISSINDFLTERAQSDFDHNGTKLAVEDSTTSSGDIELLVDTGTPLLGISEIRGPPATSIPEIGEELSHFPDASDFGEEYFLNNNNTNTPNASDLGVEYSRINNAIMPSIVIGTADANTPTVDGSEMDLLNSKAYHSSQEEENLSREGILDQFFVKGENNYDIFTKCEVDGDSVSNTNGNNNDKPIYATQDLYTVLELTSVLKRVEAGRKYISENVEGSLNTTVEFHDNGVSSGMTKKELVEYCSLQATDKCLQNDLHRIVNLKEKSKQATERIFSLLSTGFTDQSSYNRGYSWLKNVLKLHESQRAELNDMIESKEGFRYNGEGINVLEDLIYSDWNELSDPEEMWEFDRSVNQNQRSHVPNIAAMRESNESSDDFIKSYSDEWESFLND